jgi:hypothetical protein
MKPNTRVCSYVYDRRMLLKVTFALLVPRAKPSFAFAKSEFWTQKDVAAWSESERQRILKNSPWARKATVSMGAEGDFGAPMAGGGRGGGPPVGGGGPMRGGSVGGGGPVGGDGPIGGPPETFDVIVRWEAEPLRAVKKNSVPSDAEAWLISVSGLPMMLSGARPQPPEGMPRRESMAGISDPAHLARAAQLEVKNATPLHARKAERVVEGNNDEQGALLFYFDRADFPLTAATKEVTFSLRVGPMTVKAKFTPKDMMYRNELAL